YDQAPVISDTSEVPRNGTGEHAEFGIKAEVRGAGGHRELVVLPKDEVVGEPGPIASCIGLRVCCAVVVDRKLEKHESRLESPYPVVRESRQSIGVFRLSVVAA